MLRKPSLQQRCRLTGLLGILCSLLLPLQTYAQKNVNWKLDLRQQNYSPLAPGTSDTCVPGQATALLDVNNVRAQLYNTASLFYPHAVYEVPKGSGRHAIFSTNIWIGGMVNDELRIAAATYAQGRHDFEWFPGPLDNTGTPPANCEPFDRIFSISRADLDTYKRTGQPTQDLIDWPTHLGAPVHDGDGNPDNYDLEAGDRPDLIGDQMSWWVMNDVAGPHLTTGSDPVGLEARVTAYAYHTGDALDNTTFYRYRLTYRGDAPLEEAYFGLHVDSDLGYYLDDFVGSDTLRHMGYTYNGDNFDESSSPPVLGYGFRPPALGAVFLQNPETNDGESYGMSHFIQGNVSIESDLNDALDGYRLLQSIWTTGRPLTYGGSGYNRGTPTAFMYPATPPHYWSEENTDGRFFRNYPADRSFLQSTGPFTMQPGETREIAFAIVWSRGLERLDSVRRLDEDADLVHAFYAGTYDPAPVPPPPATPPRLRSPFDRALLEEEGVTLKWHSVSEDVYYEVQVFAETDTTYGIWDGLHPELSLEFPKEPRSPEEPNLEFPEEPNPEVPKEQLYRWRVRTINRGGAGPWSEMRSFFVTNPEQPLPNEFALHGNFPNPFSTHTKLSIDMPRFATVEVEVFDVLGRRVLEVPAQQFAPGAHRTLDVDASELASGIYLYRLTVLADAATWRDTGRMVITR